MTSFALILTLGLICIVPKSCNGDCIRNDFTNRTRSENINTNFGCDILKPPETPTSVHKLMPGDIKVVGALGDSITAGIGAEAKTNEDMATEYRGVVTTIGGDDDLDTRITLPNILRKYNAQLYGYSTGTCTQNSKFNAAILGALSSDMQGQAVNLVSKIFNDQAVNYENDWKLVSIFIGANDICSWCNDTKSRDPAKYVANVEDAIIALQQMPRTIVNILGVPNVYDMSNITGMVTCEDRHWYYCPCAMGNQAKIDRLKTTTKEYQRLLEESITSGKFDTRDDFTVVYQPFLHETYAPKLPDGTVDISYFAPDCFHPSAKWDAVASIALWNNMIQPVGNKDVSLNYEELQFQCPTKESPYLYTNVNSRPFVSEENNKIIETDGRSHFDTDFMSSINDTRCTRCESQQTPTFLMVLGAVAMLVGINLIVLIVVSGIRSRWPRTNQSEKLPLLASRSC